jgi:hypothetical protein
MRNLGKILDCREIVPIQEPFTNQQFVTYCELQIYDKEQWFIKYLLSILPFLRASANREWKAGEIFVRGICVTCIESLHTNLQERWIILSSGMCSVLAERRYLRKYAEVSNIRFIRNVSTVPLENTASHYRRQ